MYGADFGDHLFEHIGQQSLRPIRKRVLGMIMHLDHHAIRAYCYRAASHRNHFMSLARPVRRIDYDREMVLVAIDPDDSSRLWGGARIAADADNRRAEYSVTIRSDKQGLGLGRICLERVLDYARSRGIEEAWGSVLAENEGMLALAARLGFARRRDPDSADVFITSKRLA